MDVQWHFRTDIYWSNAKFKLLFKVYYDKNVFFCTYAHVQAHKYINKQINKNKEFFDSVAASQKSQQNQTAYTLCWASRTCKPLIKWDVHLWCADTSQIKTRGELTSPPIVMCSFDLQPQHGCIMLHLLYLRSFISKSYI